MVVLVGYASRYGATRGVAEHIAARLTARGVPATVRPLDRVEDVRGYDAVLIGSCVYGRAWSREAVDFVRRAARTLSLRPVWTFSVGPLRGQRGLLARVTWPDARDVRDVAETVRPRGHRLFAGALSKHNLPMPMRPLFRALGGRYGDFRDWDEVDAWADGIAAQLVSARDVSHADGG